MRRMLATFATAVSVIALAAGGPAVAASAWTIDQVRTPAVANGALSAVSCPSVAFCVAAGSSNTPTGAERTFIETSDGSTWARTPSPNAPGADDSALRGVSCVSPSFCVAVGESYAAGARRSLIETWNGVAWKVTPHPHPAGRTSGFRAVSCVSRGFCLAVGDSQVDAHGRTTLVERWNGSTWIVVATPSVGSTYSALLDVDCSSSTWCTAVGNAGGHDIDQEGAYLAVIENFNGTSWTVATQSAGDVGTLHGVACTSRTFCMAVGRRYSFQGGGFPTVETWNGRQWTFESVPTGAQRIDDVSCTTTTFCALVGVGGGGSYAAAWNGDSVSTTESPAPVDLVGTSCASATSCVAVGAKSRSTIQRFDGAQWTLDSAVDGTGDVGSTLSAVSCVSATFCVAVGYYTDETGIFRSLIEMRDSAGHWVPMAAGPNVGDGNNILRAVSCTSPTFCVAGGQADAPIGLQSVLMAWDGAHWTLSAAPDVYSLAGLSCTSPAFCMATGTDRTLEWNGHSWQRRALAARGRDTSLASVSCIAPDACSGAGSSYSNDYSESDTLVEHWDGSAWTVEDTPTAPAGAENDLNGISCVSRTYCVAVGTSYAVNQTPMLLTWNGTSWTTTDQPRTSGPLSAVSCRAIGSCTAVGGGQSVLTATGGTWWQTALPVPPGRDSPDPGLGGVSCSGGCRAVGGYHRPGGEVALAETSS